MSLGALARRVLGPRFFRAAANAYRAVFTNIDALATALSEQIPRDAFVVDVGGGDGAPIGALLRRRPDLSALMLDLAPAIGVAIDEGVRARVVLRPGTDVRAYLDAGGRHPDAVVVSDVLHHVDPSVREAFFTDLRDLMAPGTIGIIKDVEPKGMRAALSVFADKYVSGDRNVSAVSRELLRRYVDEWLGDVDVWETPLYGVDAPNYAIAIRRRGVA